ALADGLPPHVAHVVDAEAAYRDATADLVEFATVHGVDAGWIPELRNDANDAGNQEHVVRVQAIAARVLAAPNGHRPGGFVLTPARALREKERKRYIAAAERD